ncbi:hypothetical protein AB0M28_14795 [Streptomyces sp. NPDC051940]|uniref:hypothetical protein n=1 Tax=Streptomyces sp. NPDC051940 TaxID=3155675 RepID=UPI0034177001
MYGYEIANSRNSELRREAAAYRLARKAKAAARVRQRITVLTGDESECHACVTASVGDAGTCPG